MASAKDLIFGGGLQGAFDVNQAARQRYGSIGQDAAERLAAMGRGEVQQGINQNLLNSYQNPALEQAIRTSQLAAQRRFAEQVAPGIEQQFAGLGTLGSGRSAVATGIAQRGLEENLADIESKARLNAYDKAYSAAVNAGANEFQARQSANQYLAGLGSQNIQSEVPSNLATLMGLIGPDNIRKGAGDIYDYLFGGGKPPAGGRPGTPGTPGGGAGGGITIPGIGKIGIPGIGGGGQPGGPGAGDGEWNLPPPPGGIGVQPPAGDEDNWDRFGSGPGPGPTPGPIGGGSEDGGYLGGPIEEQPYTGTGSEDYGYLGGPGPIGGGSEDYGYLGGPGDYDYGPPPGQVIIEPPDFPGDNYDLFENPNWWNEPILPDVPPAEDLWPVDATNNWDYTFDWSLPEYNWDFGDWFDFDFGNWF